MRFELKFYVDGMTDGLLRTRECQCQGLLDLKLAREITKCPSLPMHKVLYNCIYASKSETFQLTEEQATHLLVFADTCVVEVTCPPLAFEQYLHKYVVPQYEQKKTWYGRKYKIVAAAEIGYQINRNRILEDWLRHGCPIYWDPKHPTGTYTPIHPETDNPED